jgi:glycosyltransferase involved in cell wall biosynthesis
LVVSCSGTFTYTLGLARELIRNFDVSIITNRECTLMHNEVPPEIEILRFWKRNNPLTLLKLATMVRKYKYDIIHIQFEYSMFGKPLYSHITLILIVMLFKALRLRVFITVHGIVTPQLTSPPLRRVVSVLLSMYYRLVAMMSTIIVLNSLQKKILMMYGIDPHKICVIPHGVQLIKAKNSNEYKYSAFTVLFHGFMRPSKGVHVLIEAIKVLRNRGYNVKLRILGSIPYQYHENFREREYMLSIFRKSKELNGAVEVRLGPFEDDIILREILSSDLVVLPYMDKYIESSGVAHRVMGCRKPIIVSRTPRFLADLEPNIDCIAVNPEPAEIAHAVEELLLDQELRRFLTKNIYYKARKRSWRNVAYMHTSCYIHHLNG